MDGHLCRPESISLNTLHLWTKALYTSALPYMDVETSLFQHFVQAGYITLTNYVLIRNVTFSDSSFD